MSESNPEVSRRRLLVIAGSAIALLGASACKSGPSSCTDVTGLTPEEVKTRQTVAYSDHSSDKNKTCEQCQQYVAPTEKDKCGSCKVLKGPVHPEGYCNLFVAKA